MSYKLIFTTLLIPIITMSWAQYHIDIPNSEIIAEVAGGGTAVWADIDGDGDTDLTVASLEGLKIKFYINDGGHFTSLTTDVNSTNGGSIGFADYDGDGDQDLLVTRSQAIGQIDGFALRLYQNNEMSFSLVNTDAGLQGAESHDGKWGDYDGDGDPDLAVIMEKLGKVRGVIYRNDDGVFTDIEAVLPESIDGSVDWADFDKDGDLDLLITGNNATGFEIHSTIFQNNEGVFEEYAAGLTGVMYSAGEWGDYDGDGDPDLVISGSSLSIGGAGGSPFGMAHSFIYRNDEGVFNDISAEIDDLLYSTADWGDMDNDGDLDLLITGMPAYGTPPPDFEEKPSVSKIYQNNDGIFTEVAADLTGVANGEALWADYNGDDLLDFVLLGFTQQDNAGELIANFYTSYIAPEENPLFVKDEVSAALFENVFFSNASWADYDDDLDMDLLLTGLKGTDPISYIYENANGAFVQTEMELPGIENGSAEWGAYTLGRRDILLAGMHDDQELIEVFRFNGLDAYVAAEANLKQLGDTGSGRATWGDIDNDNDLDILINGFDNIFDDNIIEETKLYLNDDGTYIEMPTDIEPLGGGAMSWGDYDGDGDLDLVVSGDGINQLVHKIYTNEEGVFVENPSTLLGVFSSNESWGDYDGDGDLDLLFNGSDQEWNFHTLIYENVDGTFSDINAGLIGCASGSVDWGDYDHDGDLDVLVTGEETDLELNTRIYQNNEGVFTEVTTNIPGIVFGMARWVNVDGDQDLDVFITGFSEEDEISEIWTNTLKTNQAPMNLELTYDDLYQSAGNEIYVGDFTATDPDEEDVLTYSLIDGASENSNEYFTVVDNALYANSTFQMPHGDHVIRVMVDDGNGGKLVNQFLIQVIDDLAPIPVVHNDLVLTLNEEGTLTISAADLDLGSYDQHSEEDVMISINTTSFSCIDLGENIIEFTAVDGSGNDSTVAVTITVKDMIPPTVATRDVILYLDVNGNTLLSPTDVDNGSTDNCGIGTRLLNSSSFTCADIGSNEVTYSVFDESGNESMATVVVTIIDSIAPTVELEDFTLTLDETGSVDLPIDNLTEPFTDNCMPIDWEFSKTSFTCDDLGENLLTVIATDGSENSTETNITVTILGDCREGVLSIESKYQMSIYPNPTSQQLTLNMSSPLSESDKIMIMDISGHNVMNTKVSKITDRLDLNVSELRDGLYLLMIKKEGQLIKQPFIKN